MDVQFDANRNRFVVRWYEDGKKRCRRFETEEDAEAFDSTLRAANAPPEGAAWQRGDDARDEPNASAIPASAASLSGIRSRPVSAPGGA